LIADAAFHGAFARRLRVHGRNQNKGQQQNESGHDNRDPYD
jgi:hypothetical protein